MDLFGLPSPFGEPTLTTQPRELFVLRFAAAILRCLSNTRVASLPLVELTRTDAEPVRDLGDGPLTVRPQKPDSFPFEFF